ncbi:MAG: DUF3795 domain-containing protein [Bacteroidales bacterium]|nr:DUF3795 domain-containing protein [Bacteroidales bacterium]
MDYHEILNCLSPCGIRCDSCFAFKDGKIKELSRELSDELGNFQNYAGRFATVLNEPVFNVYPYFKLQLDLFAQCDCKGCRNERCKLLKSCNVRECSEKKGVEFCFQCDEFPCDHSGLDENLQRRWVSSNLKMRDIGVDSYYHEIKNTHRYP